MESGLAYVPMDRRHALARGGSLPEHTSGSALFADISGFTPLTEVLTRTLGARRGADELSHQLNLVYDALIADVERYSGSVITFSGDAITCWFDDTAGPAAPRATACALALQQTMQNFTAIPLPDGTTTALALKVAIASGPVRRFLVGDPAIQWVDALAGETVQRMAEAEHLTSKGEVIVDTATIEQLGPAAQSSEWRTDLATGERFAVISRLDTLVAPVPWPALDTSLLTETIVRPWLLPAVYEHLIEGLGEFLTELRPAVALFVRFTGIAYDTDPDARSRLDAYMRWVQGVLMRYTGSFLQLTIGDKGSYFYASFGAPITHEDDTRRAVAAALELRAPPPELDFIQPVQIGISQGTMRTGAYGGTTRRTYGVLGDDVNLAARLMQSAPPGQVLVSERVQQATPAHFAWEVLPPITVKGKRDTIPIARLISLPSTRGERGHSGQLIAREMELDWLLRSLQPVVKGQFAGLIYLYGEAGIGKSHLVYALRQQLTHPTTPALAQPIIWLTCPTDELTRHSLHPFRSFLRRYFDQNTTNPAATNRTRFDTILNQLIASLPDTVTTVTTNLRDELERTRSFLAALVDIHWDGSLYEQLEPKLRFENTLLAVIALIQAESLRQPVVFHVEDAHWLDSDSQTLLQLLVRNAPDYPLALLLTARYGDDGEPFVIAVDDSVPQQVLTLHTLSLQGIRGVAAQVLTGSISDDLIEFLADKTGGNPFFIEQLVLDLRERGMLRQDAGGAWHLTRTELAEVPATISAVLIARLDRLAAQVRAVVQTASILGLEFEIRVLSQILRNDQQLPLKVRQAEVQAIWLAMSEIRYMFRHVLLRDAAYEMQLQARLRTLHGLAGAALEQVYAADLVPYAGDLTYHYGRAQNIPKERHFARLAGEQAAARFANGEAATYFSRALELTPASDLIERYTLLRAREEVYNFQGNREAQRSDLTALQFLAERLDDTARLIEVALRECAYNDLTGDYPAMEDAAQVAIGLAQTSNNTQGEAAGHIQWSRALWQQGSYDAARPKVEQALFLARAAHLPQLEAQGLRLLGNLALDQGNFALAHTIYTQALHIEQELGDRPGQSATRNNLGLVAFGLDDYNAAKVAFGQSLKIAREIGHRYDQSKALLNLGMIAAVQGNLLDARAYYEQVLRLKTEIGDLLGQSLALSNLGEVATAQGAYAHAQQAFDQALSLAQAIGHRQQAGWVLARQGLLLHQMGNHAAAHAQSEQALQLAQAIGDRETQALAFTTLGHTFTTLGQLPAATAAYQQALALRQELDQPNQAMEALAGLARVALAQASTHITTILNHLATATLDGADDPFRVYLTCYHILQSTGDPRATTILSDAHTQLQARANQFKDAAVRSAFLEQVAAHRNLLTAWLAQTRDLPSPLPDP